MADLPPPTQPPDNTGGAGSSTRPYLLRALHDWCTDNGFTPYIAVQVGPSVQVPMEYVKNNEIVLNIGFEATSGLQLGNELVEFKARFGGVGREIRVPVDHVVAIYARENGQGMAFPMPVDGGQRPAPALLNPGSASRGLRLATTDGAAEAHKPAGKGAQAPVAMATAVPAAPIAATIATPAAAPTAPPLATSPAAPPSAGKDHDDAEAGDPPPDAPPPPSGRPTLKRIK